MPPPSRVETAFFQPLAQDVKSWDTESMPKRKLRIVKRVRNVPVLGICEACNMEFSGDPFRGNAQSAIQGQFNVHKCERQVAVKGDADRKAAAET